jgi:hypothetical protein
VIGQLIDLIKAILADKGADEDDRPLRRERPHPQEAPNADDGDRDA